MREMALVNHIYLMVYTKYTGNVTPLTIMKIERLELNGFKSFDERTSFSFHPGITCIIGPNGCGKSNVVDAFKWVLGEQSVKTLRGDKMEEVIFNGTMGRRSKGMAEVTLHISDVNRDDSSNGDEDKRSISVMRRLFRSGESEYYIDKRRSRLRDIRDIFLDTGLDVKSYSILEQGRIMEVLNAKPVDRRFLIEEVAGVMKYKVRKSEALNKLDHSRMNLERIQDIIGEVKRSLDSLWRQVKRAERFKRLTVQLNAIELKMAKRDYEGLKKSYEFILNEHSGLIRETTGKIAGLRDLETEEERKRSLLYDREKTLESMTTTFQESEKGIALNEKDIAVMETEDRNITAQFERLTFHEAEYVRDREEIEEQLEGHPEREKRLEDEIKELLNEVSAVDTQIASIRDSIEEAENEMRERNRQLLRFSEEISDKTNELLMVQSAIDSVCKRKESSRHISEELYAELDMLESELETIEQDTIKREEEILLLKEKKKDNLRRMEEAAGTVESMQRSLSRERENCASGISRMESLIEITSKDLDIEAISEHIDIVATITEIIDVHPEYDIPIESALAEKVKGYIVKNNGDLLRAVQFVKEHSIEKKAFLSIEQVNHDQPFTLTLFPSESIPACEVVDTPEEYTPVVRSLLGGFVIVKDLDAAFASHKSLRENSSGKEYCYVTLDGDILEPSGVVLSGKGTTILKHLREIRELEDRIAEQKERIGNMESQLAHAIEEVGRIRDVLSENESLISRVEKDLSLLIMNRKRRKEERERVTKRISYIEMELEELEKEHLSLLSTLEEKRGVLEGLRVRRDGVQNSLHHAHEKTADEKTIRESLNASLVDKKMALSDKRMQMQSIEREKELLSGKISSVQERIEQIRDESFRLEEKRGEFNTAIGDRKQKIGHLIADADSLREKMKSAREDIDSDLLALRETDKSIKLLRSEVDSLRERTNVLDIRLAEHRVNMETLQKTVYHNYGRDIDTAEVEPLAEGEAEEVTAIREKIQGMGPVNLASIEEHDEVKTRYDFLTSQKEDLTQSITELEEAISRINSVTQKKLYDAFHRLNAQFGETFRVLFGGGNAELVLADPHNILESGIDIVVQPPGKKLQNIHLLSGGEKSLAALSLIFSGFLIKASPLCILDEADAFLDEQNTLKFAEMIRDLSEKNQFIIITHNRRTMEIADYIYGISSEEAGISKVVSVQFSDS